MASVNTISRNHHVISVGRGEERRVIAEVYSTYDMACEIASSLDAMTAEQMLRCDEDMAHILRADQA